MKKNVIMWNTLELLTNKFDIPIDRNNKDT